MSTVNLITLASDNRESQRLELVKIGADDTAVVPFTADAVQLNLHYCDTAQFRGYAHCVGDGCLLCKAGRKVDERLALPVHVPTTDRIAVLLISKTIRPGSLLPKLIPHLANAGDPGARRQVLFLSRSDRGSFEVGCAPLTAGDLDGAVAVRRFLDEHDREAAVRAAVATLDDTTIRSIPDFARMLQLKEVE